METALYIKGHKLFSNINGFVISCDYHVTKSSGELFDILLKEYSLNPSECYFIDDSIINIDIAKKIGFKTYKYKFEDNIEDLVNDMKENGIVIDN